MTNFDITRRGVVGGVATMHTGLAEQTTQILDVVADRAARRLVGLYEETEVCTPRHRLESQGARACKQVDHAPPAHAP